MLWSPANASITSGWSGRGPGLAGPRLGTRVRGQGRGRATRLVNAVFDILLLPGWHRPVGLPYLATAGTHRSCHPHCRADEEPITPWVGREGGAIDGFREMGPMYPLVLSDGLAILVFV